MDKNYYEILGISPDTDQSLIKAAAQLKANTINEAFRQLNDTEKQHNQASIQAQVNEINEAFRVLNDVEQRKMYDAQRINKQYGSVSKRQLPDAKQTVKQQTTQTGVLSHLLERMTITPPAFKDVVIFAIALLFFLYMLSGLFVNPQGPNEPSELNLGAMQKKRP
ncbi:J domain-containing protein [Beggiatoa leptomitoformis]|uniref:DnaJ domain-containing protein n=1 Tax=Beggiatoa leptomitoformis TaxID=288004 RepID=A0A2N9YGN8_9GAMM|nr:DnaJ domain-containing protein [Beggiatoa leptomitoformis]ALG68052.1 DnaJ domain-containing protein [Beggiatoa leptomitoformis]AUI69657.1 DnaJ domain-containing protein [Beggiatoa leptomitoformis]